MERWVSFEKLRKELSFVKLLEFHNLRFTPKGDQLVGPCPLPGHGQDRKKKCFSANTAKGIFQCFQCRAKGNVLDFATLMAGRNPENGADLRKTALELQERFLGSSVIRQMDADDKRLSEVAGNADKVAVNVSLDFELKDLDYAHPYLRERGFTTETMKHFGVGYCDRGWLKGRCAIPLRDTDGRLVGYAGRLVKDDPNTPKYMLPGERERHGKILKFSKSLFVYNGHGIRGPVEDLVIVEGFPSVWWLHQCGYRNSVALMGDSFSKEQFDLILRYTQPTGRAWIISDGDFEGRRGLGLLAQHLVKERLTRLIDLPDGKQPTDLSERELRNLLAFAGK